MKARFRLMTILLFALVTGGAGFWMAVGLNASPVAIPEPAATAALPQYQLLNMDEIYVNLKNGPAHDAPTERLMKLRVGVLYDPAQMPGTVKRDLDLRRSISAEEPQIRDLFLAFLRQLDAQELSGSLGMEMLKSELLKRARIATGHDAAQEILIAEMVIQ